MDPQRDGPYVSFNFLLVVNCMRKGMTWDNIFYIWEVFSVPKLNSNEFDKAPKSIYYQRKNEQCTNKSSQ